MIQTILFFILGFLTAGFLALMIAPAIWNRAVRLTRRRIEASIPLTMSDIQADKDRIRAEHAIATRRLEISLKELREKSAAQLLEINRLREEGRGLVRERDEISSQLEALASDHSDLRTDFEERERQLGLLAEKFGEVSKTLDLKTNEVESLELMFEEASFSSSNRQIELVARESELGRMKEEVRKLRGERKEAERRMREAIAEGKRLEDELRGERRRLDDLEARTERLIAAVSDRDEKLDRREKDLERLRERLRAGGGSGGSTSDVADLEERARLEGQIGEIKLQLARILPDFDPAAPAAGAEALLREKSMLAGRIEGLERENEKLRGRIAAMAEGGDEPSILREQIADLAAEVVHLSAMVDSPGSPLHRVLEEEILPGQDSNGASQPISLAQRIRSLQRAAGGR